MAPATTPPTPMTAAQIQELVQQLHAKVAQLEGENQQLQLLAGAKHKAKIEAPAKYRGDKDELTRFLTQMNAYL